VENEKKNIGINKSFGWTMKMVRSRDNKNPISLVFTIIQPENSYMSLLSGARQVRR
jgi:hypothetical protein